MDEFSQQRPSSLDGAISGALSAISCRTSIISKKPGISPVSAAFLMRSSAGIVSGLKLDIGGISKKTTFITPSPDTWGVVNKKKTKAAALPVGQKTTGEHLGENKVEPQMRGVAQDAAAQELALSTAGTEQREQP